MNKRILVFAVLGLLLILGMTVSIGVGVVQLTPAEVWAALSGNAAQTSHAAIVWDFRFARVLLVALCGAALGASGAGFQGLFRNPLADPFVVGASSGAALGATLSVVMGDTGPVIPMGVAGFFGAILAVFLVYALAETSSYGSIAGLLLAGTALSTMLSAFVSLLMILDDEVLHEIFAWLLGGFSGRSWGHLQQAALIAPLGIIALWLMARPLDALSAGDQSAASIGLNIRRSRIIVVAAASLATAAAVAAGGIIGFVGLIGPHLARPLVGAKHAHVIPASMLLGALLLLLADSIARTIMPPMELPVGVFTALLGGPFFLVLLHRGNRGRL